MPDFKTPNFDMGKSILLDVVEPENAAHNILWYLLAPEQHGGTFAAETITQLYVRGIFYHLLAAARGWAFYPDAIRTPLITYINNATKLKMNEYAQSLIKEAGAKQAKEVNDMVERLGQEFGNLQIQVPSCLAYILQNCKAKSEFIDVALNLREDSQVRKIRKFIMDVEQAIKTGDLDKARELANQERLVIEGVNLPVESFIENAATVSSGMMGNPVDFPELLPGSVGLAYKLGQYLRNRWRTRNLVFLKTLSKRVRTFSQMNDDFDRIFKSRLTNEQIASFRNIDNRDNRSSISSFRSTEDPLEVLNLRFAKGDIDNVPYQEMKNLSRTDSV